ncbi:Ferredoxin [Phaffia rhodozyma]|uniref:Ferredoxin n=1 Tax=Phaffia rhodozyma TaxID=264483 RepID=A0A0F7SI14_PHARH|nr:Ferredoxin [Phaffia rhodozyma]
MRHTAYLRTIFNRATPITSLTSPPFTTELLRSTASPSKTHLLLHLPVVPSKWPAKFSPHNFPAGDIVERSVIPGLENILEATSVTDEKVKGALARAKAKAGTVGMLIAWDGTKSDLPNQDDSNPIGLDTLKEKDVEGVWYIPGKKKIVLERGRIDKPIDINAVADRIVEGKGEEKEEIDIYICTHGSRDCRCGDVGGALVDALQVEIDRLDVSQRVNVWEVSHVGGHKYAANALIFPAHQLLGNLRPSHAPLLLSSLLSSPADPTASSPLMLPFWRGTSGMSKAEMDDRYEKALSSGGGIGAPWIESASKGAEADFVKDIKQEKEEVPIIFKTWEGEDVEVIGTVGETLMDLGKRYDLGSIEGVCGGVLECATCHCYVPFEPYPAPVSEITDAEEDMLGMAIDEREESRLGCQIKVDQALSAWCAAGGKIGLPRY